jgi:pSer/pThr/pTyr-binding forkhead associated (FHA) protein
VPAPPPTVASPTRTKQRQWRLVVVQPQAERGHAFAVEGDATLGRGGGCTVPLAFDTFVSQVHARVTERDGSLWIEDIGSTNGTYVNGQRIAAPTKIGKGDRVQVGETVLEAER